jgi:hypothetical protein
MRNRLSLGMSSRPKLSKIIVLLSFCFGTILFFNYYARYDVAGPELLQDATDISSWKHSNLGVSIDRDAVDTITLHSSLPTETIFISRMLADPQRFDLLRFACDIKTQNIRRNDVYWKTARIVAISYNQKNEPMYNIPHLLFYQHDDNEWEHHENIFPIDRRASALELTAQLLQTTGTMSVRNVSLRPVAETESFKRVRLAALALWIVILAWIGLPIVREGFTNPKLRTPLMFALLIIIGVLMPENIKEQLGNWLFPPSPLNPPMPARTVIVTGKFDLSHLLTVLDIYKIGHFSAFTLLATTLFNNKSPRTKRTTLLGYIMLFALMSEVLQLFIAGRTARLGDFLIDCIGIGFGFLFSQVIRVLRSSQITDA